MSLKLHVQMIASHEQDEAAALEMFRQLNPRHFEILNEKFRGMIENGDGV